MRPCFLCLPRLHRVIRFRLGLDSAINRFLMSRAGAVGIQNSISFAFQLVGRRGCGCLCEEAFGSLLRRYFLRLRSSKNLKKKRSSDSASSARSAVATPCLDVCPCDRITIALKSDDACTSIVRATPRVSVIVTRHNREAMMPRRYQNQIRFLFRSDGFMNFKNHGPAMGESPHVIGTATVLMPSGCDQEAQSGRLGKKITNERPRLARLRPQPG
jgi:hypothetical protein